MKILILEDDKNRIDFFKKHFNRHELIFVDSCRSALNNLYNQKFDIVYVDHDIPSDNPNNNGYKLIKKVVESKLQKKASFLIHSMNPVGANNMLKTLQHNGYDAHWIPFHLLTSIK